MSVLSEEQLAAIERLEDWVRFGGPNDVRQWPEIATDLRSILVAIQEGGLASVAESAAGSAAHDAAGADHCQSEEGA